MMTHLQRRRRRRSRHRKPPGGSGETFAALDLGTNNCRLLVATPEARNGFRVIDAFSRIVRLGEGLARYGVLSDAAMRRTIEALQVCAQKMDRCGVVRARNVATEACRKARNCTEFIDKVNDVTGLDIETISSEEEVRLVLQGCLPLLREEPNRALVFDIGGGSTEVVWIALENCRPRILDWVSMPLGVVTLSERYGDDPMPAAAYAQLIDEVDAYLEPFCDCHGIGGAVEKGAVQMLGTSGTVTTLSGVKLGLPRYNRAAVDGTYLPFDAIEDISQGLRRMECADRAAQPCIGSERADLVVAGCAVLQAICARWPVGRLRVADRGIREGILCELMGVAASRRAASATQSTPGASSPHGPR